MCVFRCFVCVALEEKRKLRRNPRILALFCNEFAHRPEVYIDKNLKIFGLPSTHSIELGHSSQNVTRLKNSKKYPATLFDAKAPNYSAPRSKSQRSIDKQHIISAPLVCLWFTPSDISLFHCVALSSCVLSLCLFSIEPDFSFSPSQRHWLTAGSQEKILFAGEMPRCHLQSRSTQSHHIMSCLNMILLHLYISYDLSFFFYYFSFDVKTNKFSIIFHFKHLIFPLVSYATSYDFILSVTENKQKLFHSLAIFYELPKSKEAKFMIPLLAAHRP